MDVGLLLMQVEYMMILALGARVLTGLIAAVQNVGSPRMKYSSGLAPSVGCTCGVMSAVPCGIVTTLSLMPALPKNSGPSWLAGPEAPGTSMTRMAAFLA